MRNSIRWSVIVGALLLAAVVGFESYQAGVEHGIEQSGKIVVASPAAPAPGAYPVPYPYPYPYYGWHGPWHFGFGPIILLFFGFAILRGLFWRRRFPYGVAYGGGFRGGPGGGCDPRSRLDEWHRQAHAQDGGGLNPPGATSAP